jgi:hypothetical protein
MAMVFYLDSFLAVFLNYKPRLLLSDLNFDLQCPDPVWQATSSLSCRELLAEDGTITYPNLAMIMLAIGRDEWSPEEAIAMRSISCRGLYTVIICIYKSSA